MYAALLTNITYRPRKEDDVLNWKTKSIHSVLDNYVDSILLGSRIRQTLELVRFTTLKQHFYTLLSTKKKLRVHNGESKMLTLLPAKPG
jgi:hypothetical protein